MTKTNIVRIGNSRGVIIPKHLLEQCHIEDKAELYAHGGVLYIRSLSHPRKDWDKEFERMAREGDDKLLDEEVGSRQNGIVRNGNGSSFRSLSCPPGPHRGQ